MSFKSFNFDQKINNGIQACGYTAPTPIQLETIPQILKGRDIMGLAQTGTGKTAAFVLPMLQKLVSGPRRQVRAVIVAPTRELAEQIHENIEKLGRQTGLRSVSVYGGVSKVGQLKSFRTGVEIIVACPGRLLDHLDSGDLKISGIEILVLDEADMMFDMGFLPAIKRLLKYMPKTRQNLLFSATMPEAVKKLADSILVDPVTVQINHSKPADTVSHVLFNVEKKGKTPLLKSLMKETEMTSTLVFTRTKYGAKNLAVTLLKEGHQAVALQGNMSQNKRREAMEGFKKGQYNVLVATDIAARGIDVSGISHVINYDVPDTVEAYTHRIGRTGRAQCTGEAITFAAREDFRFIKDVESNLNSKMLLRETPENARFESEPTELPSGNRHRPAPKRNQARGIRKPARNAAANHVFNFATSDGKPERDENFAGKTSGHHNPSAKKTYDHKGGKAQRGRRSAPMGLDFVPRARRRGQSSTARPQTER
ncbi:MAG: DEAD/DEAH box helicase [Proteobacteria bacterium]|nr:DEAD/DEAH box helicase [Pseudomonadota bacterium]MBU1736780.1 DEAD/DEAH box helicase [Pseudomonadota bacterium]